MNGSFYNSKAQSLKTYTAKTFGFMFLGLLCTFAVMIGIYKTGLVTLLLSIPAMIILGAVELITVIYLSARIEKLSIPAAKVLFFIYAILNGLMFATYFLYFEVSVLVLAFGVTALYFGIMAAVGYFTSVDLSRIQPILVSGIIFLIIVNLLGMFFGFGGMERLVCFAGVALFLGFTAYDTQKIKALYQTYNQDEDMLKRASIISALQLYLDFINLFINILKLFSKR